MEVPVYLSTYASCYIGNVDIKSPEEFDKAADALWESKDYDFPTLCHQCSDVDLGDWDILEEDISSYFK